MREIKIAGPLYTKSREYVGDYVIENDLPDIVGQLYTFRQLVNHN